MGNRRGLHPHLSQRYGKTQPTALSWTSEAPNQPPQRVRNILGVQCIESISFPRRLCSVSLLVFAVVWSSLLPWWRDVCWSKLWLKALECANELYGGVDAILPGGRGEMPEKRESGGRHCIRSSNEALSRTFLIGPPVSTLCLPLLDSNAIGPRRAHFTSNGACASSLNVQVDDTRARMTWI